MITHPFKKAGLALGVACALSAVSAGAFANAASCDTIGDCLLTDTDSKVVTTIGGGTFTDFFTFTLTGNASVDGWLMAFNSNAVKFTEVDISGPGSFSWSKVYPNVSTIWESGLLNAGTYEIKLLGTSSANSAYSFSTFSQPVPEPGEWAMILAGLGMVGVMARRRSQQG